MPQRAVKIAGLVYALSAFAVMWVFWVWFVIFLANAPSLKNPWVNPSVDVGDTIATPLAAAVNIGLISIFALQHSLMARMGFKQWLTRYVPRELERATYVHMANFAAIAIPLFWQPMPQVIWHIEDGQELIWAAFALGWMILLGGALSINIWELLGVRQAWAWFDGRRAPPLVLKRRGLYRLTTHPMYVGILLAVWATPHMTVGHALLAAGFTVYILVAYRYEERDLARRYGPSYRQWRSSGISQDAGRETVRTSMRAAYAETAK